MRVLETLSLHSNSFVGELPLSLRDCSSLVFLDLSSNKLRGEIPGWIGESMSSLEVLSLHSNGFNGSIPPNLCYLSNILILDLSLNNISGIIPKCLNNLTFMVDKNTRNIPFRVMLFLVCISLELAMEHIRMRSGLDGKEERMIMETH
jgi:hypothetical protein